MRQRAFPQIHIQHKQRLLCVRTGLVDTESAIVLSGQMVYALDRRLRIA
jgi:hypothetical protein